MKSPVGPDKELINRAFRMKLVVNDRDGQMFFVEPIDLYEKIYSMDRLTGAGRAGGHVQKIGEIEILMPATLWGGEVGGPTIAQVLPQIPPEWIDKTVAFHPYMAEDHTGSNGYVRGAVDLYGGTLPEDVRKQPVIAWHKTYTKPFPDPEPSAPKFNAVAATTLDEDVRVMKPIELKKNPPPPTIIK
jgi:hypothetical protein